VSAVRGVRWAAVGLGLAAVLFGVGGAGWRFTPPLPETVTLEATFEALPVGRAEPLVVTGRAGEADLVHVTRTGPATLRVSVERWGRAARESEPLAFQPGQRHRLRVTLPSLATTRDSARNAGGWARVEFDDRPVLAAEVPLLLRESRAAWMGEQPLGSTTVAPRFSGALWVEGQTVD
jgi:hypothetical protein